MPGVSGAYPRGPPLPGVTIIWNAERSIFLVRRSTFARAEALVTAKARWDKRFWDLQVTDLKVDAMDIRVLMTAQDATIAFDLRCDIREGMMQFIAAEMPEAIVQRRVRTDIGGLATKSR